MNQSDNLLAAFVRHYPFQPATAYWRAVEIGHVVAQPFPKGKGLDLGCGDGKLTQLLAAHVGERTWIGIDLDSAETQLARETGLYDTVHTVSAAAIPEPDATFDFVFSNSVLEHIPDLAATLREASRVLKPGGEFLFTVPSEAFHSCLHGPILPGQSRDGYLRDLDARCAHLRYFSEADWAEVLAPCGLQIARVTRYLTPAQTRRWEVLSRLTAGLLFTLYGKRKRPIEIQHALGLRRQGRRLPKPLARLLASAASIGAPAEAGLAADAPDGSGCLMVLARKI